MTKFRFEGIYPMLYAFFDESGALDRSACRMQVDACIAAGAHGLAIGGLATLAGCIFDRRGLAISVIIAVVFVSMVINFVDPFLGPRDDAAALVANARNGHTINGINFVSLLSYYRPVDVVRHGEWPLRNMAVLLSIGLATWTVGLLLYRWKDVPTR